MSKGQDKDGQVRTFELEVDGESFTFNVTMASFNRFIRESQRDVGQACNNLLLTSCTERAKLQAAIDEDWSLPLQLIEPIQRELIPVRQVVVKKSSSSQQS